MKLFPDPSRLEGLLIANQVEGCAFGTSPSHCWQVSSYCNSVANFSGLSFNKLYLIKELQENPK